MTKEYITELKNRGNGDIADLVQFSAMNVSPPDAKPLLVATLIVVLFLFNYNLIVK
jgi:hypothetical protein